MTGARFNGVFNLIQHKTPRANGEHFARAKLLTLCSSHVLEPFAMIKIYDETLPSFNFNYCSIIIVLFVWLKTADLSSDKEKMNFPKTCLFRLLLLELVLFVRTSQQPFRACATLSLKMSINSLVRHSKCMYREHTPTYVHTVYTEYCISIQFGARLEITRHYFVHNLGSVKLIRQTHPNRQQAGRDKSESIKMF